MIMSDEAQEGEDVVRIVPLGKGKRPAALGRGLSALLGDIQTDVPVNNPASLRDGFSLLAIADVHPHPLQPRRRFDEDALKELAESIAARGVVQPILVRPAPSGQGYQLVAGERRWRASQRAGLHQIPAIVRDLDETETFTIALIENIQRQDLTAIEEAEAYARLRDQLGHSQDAIGQMTGKSPWLQPVHALLPADTIGREIELDVVELKHYSLSGVVPAAGNAARCQPERAIA